MKITPEHYAYMRAAILPVLPTLLTVAQYAALPNVKDASKRQRWDAMYAAGLSSWVCDTVYKYANDEHIDTALRAIVRNAAT